MDPKLEEGIIVSGRGGLHLTGMGKTRMTVKFIFARGYCPYKYCGRSKTWLLDPDDERKRFPFFGRYFFALGDKGLGKTLVTLGLCQRKRKTDGPLLFEADDRFLP